MKSKKRKSKSMFCSKKYAELLQFIKESRKFIFVVIGLFLFSGVIGFFYPGIFADILTSMIKDIIAKTSGLNFSQMLAFIIYNNTKTSILGLLLGFLFGIFPIFLSVLNGYMMGFVFNKLYINNGIHDSWRILPHGIFELPAFFLSLGLGLGLGYTLFFKPRELKEKFKMSLKTFAYVILPLLLVAGFIETCLIFLMK